MYRWANAADKAAVRLLWAENFEISEPYYSWYFNTVYRPELTLGDFDGPRLAAMLQISPYTLQLRGAALPIAYLVGVITAPALRGQGRGHALLQEAHQWLTQQGYAAALLYTDIAGFYAPLGYSHCYQRQLLDLPAEKFHLLTRESAGPTTWREGDPNGSIPALMTIYQSMTLNYDGYIRRSQPDWQKYLGEHNCDNARLAVAANQAYLLYMTEKDTLQLTEVGFIDSKTLRQALAEAARIATAAGVKRLRWFAPLNAPRLLPYLAAAYWQTTPFVMARLLNPPAVLNTLACPPAVQQLVSRLDIVSATKLIFGAPKALSASAALSRRERNILTEFFPPLPGWVNEYT